MSKDQNKIETERMHYEHEPLTPPHGHQPIEPLEPPSSNSWTRTRLRWGNGAIYAILLGALFIVTMVLRHETALARIEVKLDYIMMQLEKKP